LKVEHFDNFAILRRRVIEDAAAEQRQFRWRPIVFYRRPNLEPNFENVAPRTICGAGGHDIPNDLGKESAGMADCLAATLCDKALEQRFFESDRRQRAEFRCGPSSF